MQLKNACTEQKKAEMRQKETTRKMKCRESIKNKQVTGFASQENPTEILKDIFKRRTSKHRTLTRFKDDYPKHQNGGQLHLLHI